MRESLYWLAFQQVFTCSKLIYSSMALDGGLIREANNCSQWFFSLHSVASRPAWRNHYSLRRTAYCSYAKIDIALFLASFLPQHQVTHRPQTDLCHHLHWLSRSALFTWLSEFVVHGFTGLLFESFIYNLDWSFLSEQHWDQFGWTFENTDHFPVD